MFKDQLPVQEGNTLRMTGDSRSVRKGQDTDIYTYEETNQAGDLVARYEVHDSMSIYPPFGRTVTFTATDSTGKTIIPNGRLSV
ncbi:hypothetical protein GCM10023116_27980 [Kistimonas scapharcae]|uniref:Uncharacterized protein n=1 Tax=Kistimonas scapharcae TaxID=1036133 RepID=A0ABP8V5F5_9GAMM